jgi:hypothetical protein
MVGGEASVWGEEILPHHAFDQPGMQGENECNDRVVVSASLSGSHALRENRAWLLGCTR